MLISTRCSFICHEFGDIGQTCDTQHVDLFKISVKSQITNKMSPIIEHIQLSS